MAKRKETQLNEETVIANVDNRGTTIGFFEKNQKNITAGLIGLMVGVALFLGYKYFVKEPNQKACQKEMFQAEAMFEKDSFSLALNGVPNSYQGFAELAGNYGSTEAGKLCKYYAGIASLNLGQFDKAVSYLEDAKVCGTVLPIARFTALGDAYAEMKNMDKAASCYDDAIDAGDNELLTPSVMKKYAMLKEINGDKSTALKTYTALKDKYPTSSEARDIDKYIIRSSN
jgi:tetratricopeptide (TPR) repeat protein